MKDQIIEKIKKYLDFVATETFSQPGRFTNEDIDKIKSLGYDIRHYSYCDGKILTLH